MLSNYQQGVAIMPVNSSNFAVWLPKVLCMVLICSGHSRVRVAAAWWVLGITYAGRLGRGCAWIQHLSEQKQYGLAAVKPAMRLA